SSEDLFVGGIGADSPFHVPFLVPDAERLQKVANRLRVGDLAVLVLDADAGHDSTPIENAREEGVRNRRRPGRASTYNTAGSAAVSISRRAVHSRRNSNISTCRRASATSRPQVYKPCLR